MLASRSIPNDESEHSGKERRYAMATTIIDAIDEMRRDAWDKWTWDNADPSLEAKANALDELKERLNDWSNLGQAFAIGRELGMEWAPHCRKRIENTDITNPIEQLDGETLPPLFQEIESKLDSNELVYFRSGFGWGVADYQDTINLYGDML